ncbi:MAG: ABC transporter ATP-binding protein [Bacteroides sp.]|nr:ABC transporter ATP-binding protein [Bacteroides sp.]
MIELNNLTYAYFKGRNVLAGLTTSIGSGIHLLLGENGAGKTTLLHIIAGLLIPGKPDECTVNGEIPGKRLPSLMQEIFFVSDNMTFPFKTIADMVHLHAPYYPNFDPEMLRQNLTTFGISETAPIDSFSLGNRKKAILAYAFSLRTSVLLLDEPANGLDITAKQLTLSMMSKCIDASQTVILSTHTVADFMPLFDSVMLLSAGRMVINKPVWEITDRIDFVANSLPPENALYLEQVLGQFRAIIPHTAGDDVTDIDYTLLYNALQNPACRHKLITLFNNANSES